MKTDYLRRIDQNQNGNGKRAYGVPTSSGTGLPYSASLTPQPITIPVALETGKLHPGWLPDFAPNSGYGEGSPSGQQIIAPWVYLVQPLPAGAVTMTVTANGLAVGDNITLSHASMPNEEAAVTGGPVQVGAVFEYTISRPNEQHDYPAYTKAYNRGSASDGGWVTIVSGDQSDNLIAPHINLWTYDADGNAERRVRIGRLQGLSAGEKAQFPKVEDWNVYGLYADAAYLRGQIVADSGDIAGDLDVGGTLGVWSGLGRAGVVLGNSEGGHGITLQNREGRPVFGAVSPYEDESGVLSDVAVWIENKGEKGLYYHLDPATDEYRLEIGVETLIDGQLTAANILAGAGAYPGTFTGMRFGAEGLQGYNAGVAQVDLDVQDGRLYFGNREGWLGDQGMTIDARTKPTGTDELEHTIHWYNSSAYGDLIGAAIGSDGPGGWWAFARKRMLDVSEIGAQQVNDFYEARITLDPGGTSSWGGQTLNIAADERLTINAGGGQTSSFERDRAVLPGLTVGSTLHSTDDGLTVGFGTQAAGSAARVVIEQDNRPAFRAQRGDHYMTIALSSYIPSGQQSAPPGGYVMRANSTIGISQANASAEWIAIQNWLRTHGLQPYTPQLAILANQNIATQYDEGTSGLDWSASAIDATKLFPAPLVFDYTEFFYKTSPNALAWTLSGSPVTQDAIDPAVLATVLANTLAWFRANGIATPWIMIDEPPHGTAPDWTQAIEDRVVKFTAAAVVAGWTVGVAVPGPTQLAYWRTRLTPTRWILAAKHERNEYATNLPSAQIWLYNRTNKAAGKPMAGLAQQMRDFGAVGYLHWSADSDVGTWPLVTLSGLTVTETLYGTQLIEELRLFAETDVPPAQPVYEQWFTTTGNMILNARSGYVLQPSGFPISLGAAARPFEHVYAKHLHGALGSQIALVSGSSMYISAWSPVQAVGLETANTVVYFEQSDLPVGKFLRATNPDDDSWEVVKVLSTGLPAGDWWEYELERGLDGLQQYWPEGTTWADLGGNAADGYVRLWGADDENPDTGPAIGIWQRDNDDAYDSTSLRFLAGNLNGFYDFNANTWGLAAGRHAGKWFSVTDEGGLRIMDASTQRAVYREYAQIGNPDANNVLITDSALSLGAGSTYTITMDTSGDMDLTGTLAVATGGAITWAGGKGRADDTGLEHVEDADSFFKVEPDATRLVWARAVSFATTATIESETAAGAAFQAVADSGQGLNAVSISGYGVYSSGGAVGVEGFSDQASGIGVKATASGDATIALQIVGGIVDGGSQRYTALADATADTDALNRQTGDGRYLLQTGTATGATTQAQTFNFGLIVNETSNDSDSRFEGNTDANLLFVDAGADMVGIGTNAPGGKLQVTSTAAASIGLLVKAAASQSANLIDVQSSTGGGLFAVDSIGRVRVGTTAAATQEMYITTSRVVSNSIEYPMIYCNNSNNGGAGHAGVSLSRGSEAAVSSFAFLVAGASSFEVGDNSNHMFFRDGGAWSYTKFARFGHGIPADTIYATSTSMRFNDGGNDYDVIIEGDTATELLRADAGLDAVQIGTTTAGVIADFRSAAIVFNEDGADRDTRIEGDTEPNLTLWDASADTVYSGGTTTRLATDKNGDTWWEAAGAGLPFGSCYGNEIGWAQAAAAQNTWYAIADADMSDGQLNLVTHDGSGKLTVAKAGRYLINYAVSLQCDSVNTHGQTGVSVSGTVANDGIQHFEIPDIAALADTQLTMASTAILSLAASATVEIALRTTDAGDPDFAVDHLNITIVQVGG